MASWQSWLAGDADVARSQLAVPAAKFFNWYQVSKEVGKVSNDHAGLVAPLKNDGTPSEASPSGQAPQTDLFAN